MCTVSWRRDQQSYDLFFNRDELNSRAAEQPPIPAQHNGVAYLGPRDGDHGGTWLLVNEFGLTVCLLNDYSNPWRPPASSPRFSRGQLVLACAAAENHDAVFAILRDQPLAQTLPFRLLAFSPTDGPMLIHWQGERLTRHDSTSITPPLSSSSYETDEVVSVRIARFAEYVRTPQKPKLAELAAYHGQYRQTSGAHSVLMQRPDATTRSICHVRITGENAELEYRQTRRTPSGPVLLEPLTFKLPLRLGASLAR